MSKHTKEPKGWECYWHEKGKLAGYRLGYENALKAQWHPYNHKDKTTWPEKEGEYVCFYEKDLELKSHVLIWADNPIHKEYWKKQDITHYMPITPPGEVE